MTNMRTVDIAFLFVKAASVGDARKAFDLVKNSIVQDRREFLELTQKTALENLMKGLQEDDYEFFLERINKDPKSAMEVLDAMQLGVEFSRFAQDTRGEDAPAVCVNIKDEVSKLNEDQYNDLKQLVGAIKRAADAPAPKRPNPFAK